MSDLFNKLLNHFNLTKESFEVLTKEPSFSSIPLLNRDDENVSKAKQRILQSIKAHEDILIYGDYDCDGIMSTSIMMKAIKKLGGSSLSYIPSRYIDGYALTLENAKKIALKKYKLVILVDNGISAFEGIDFLTSNNIDVIVIDHHEIKDKLPECYAILHPNIQNYGEYPISAGYLSFIFSVTLLDEVDDYLLTLGATSTLSDMMPLKGHNREIVRLAINAINNHQYEQFFALTKENVITSSILSLTIIPCINAIGRLVEDTTINRLIPYFIEDDNKKILHLSLWMQSFNTSRKEATRRCVENIQVNADDYGVVAISNEPEGLNGLVANQLMTKYKKPIVIFSKSKKDNNLLVGSARSTSGLSIVDCINELGPIIVAGGGHEMAGGITIKGSDYDTFKSYFNKYCFNHPTQYADEDFIEIEEKDISFESLNLVDSLAPYGVEWKEPKFVLKNIKTENCRFLKDGKILCNQLNRESKIFSFSISKNLVENLTSFDVVGTFKKNNWNNTDTVEYLCELLDK